MKKIVMKRFIGVLTTLFAVGTLVFIINSCTATNAVANKSGTQLWGENCNRCHNTPPSSTYANEQWEIVDMHMKLRANLTPEESERILQFLQSGN